MFVVWKIRYINRETRELGDRTLVLDTDSLEPTQKASVELVIKESGTGSRAILRFRDIFQEKDANDMCNDPNALSQFHITFIPDYFEDDKGSEVTLNELGQIRSGDPNTRLYSGACRPHDIQLDLANPTPIPIAGISMTPEDMKVFGYFERDLKELAATAFMIEGPGTIHATHHMSSIESSEPELKTAVNDDEIRSAVTIFRRLYMAKEPANFLKSVRLYSEKLEGHPFADWVTAEGEVYEQALQATCSTLPLTMPVTFTRKRLIDVYLYTQYHHQPSENRQNQFKDCLNQVDGKKQFLMFMFLVELNHVCHTYLNAGRVIVAWFRRYCEHHKTSADVLQSLRHDNPHLGVEEKKADRTARLFREQVETLAVDLWHQAGCPSYGPKGYLHVAGERLRAALDD